MGMLATAEALRHTLQLIEPRLAGFTPPSGTFDVGGSWTHSYKIVPVQSSLAPRGLGGHLTIRRSSQADGAVLEVEQQRTMMKQYASWDKASIQCAGDQLSTPRRWTVESWSCRPDGNEEPQSRLKFAAEVAGSEIRFSGVRKPPLRGERNGRWTHPCWTLCSGSPRTAASCRSIWSRTTICCVPSSGSAQPALSA